MNKRVTVYDILAEDENGEKVIYARGNRKDIERLFHEIIGESHFAQWTEKDGKMFFVYAYGSTRTTHPERMDVHTLNLLEGRIKRI